MGRRAVFYVSLGAVMGLFQWHLVNQLSKQKEKKRRGEESRGRGKGGRESKKREASKQARKVFASFHAVHTLTPTAFKAPA